MTSPRDLFRRFESSSETRRILLRDADGGIALSGPALRDEVLAVVRRLRGAGTGPEDLVLLAGASGVPFVTGILAAWACDTPVLPADPQFSPAEVEKLRDAFSPGVILRGGAGDLLPERVEAPRRPPLPAGTAVVKLSSGSTGRPRGIAVTARQLLSDTEHLLQGMGIGPEDWNIGVIPLSHSYGMDSLLMPLVARGNPLLLAAPLPEPLSKALSVEEPAVFPGIPCLFDLLGRPEGPSFTPRGLKTCISAGALLRSSTARAFRERFGLPVRAFYGCSETGGITYDASPSGEAAESSQGCVGTPLPGVRIGLEEEGRVVVRGGNVASGYVGGDGEPADGEFSDGAFRTGDIGRLDGEGRLHLTGRIGSLVNVSGRKVNPREIEEALLLLPGVSDAAVLGIPDEARGESLLACLVPEGDLTRDRVMSHLRERLAAYKLPRRILFLAGIPRNERGKPDRRELLLRARGAGG